MRAVASLSNDDSRTVFYDRPARAISSVSLTDGIVDACNGYAEEFGDERLVNLVMLHRDRPAEEVCRAVIGAVRQWMCDSDHDDDMTVIALKVGQVGD